MIKVSQKKYLFNKKMSLDSKPKSNPVKKESLLKSTPKKSKKKILTLGVKKAKLGSTRSKRSSVCYPKAPKESRTVKNPERISTSYSGENRFGKRYTMTPSDAQRLSQGSTSKIKNMIILKKAEKKKQIRPLSKSHSKKREGSLFVKSETRSESGRRKPVANSVYSSTSKRRYKMSSKEIPITVKNQRVSSLQKMARGYTYLDK